jgi:hypothetical protein
MESKAIKKTKGFATVFLEEDPSDGLGAKPKREIDILVVHLLMKYGGLATRMTMLPWSCSFLP